MTKSISSFSKKLNVVVSKFSRNVLIRTISAGMARILPVTIIASFIMVLQNLRFDAYQNFLESSGLGSLLGVGVTMTNGLISLYILICLASEMAKIYKKDQLNAILISLIAFLIVTPLTNFDVDGKVVQAFTLTNFGSKGIFVAMIVSLVATRAYVFLIDKGIRIKMPKDVPSAISHGFDSMIIAVIISVGFLIVAALIQLTSYSDIHNLIYSFLQKPLEGMGNSLWTMLLICMIGEGFWWFGIHGSNVTSAVVKTIYLPLALANAEAVASGLAPQFILNSFFLDVYKGPRHLALACMLLFWARSNHLKSIGKVAIIPGIFGISEPMKFGIPMIFNPVLLIPMTLAPVVSVIIAYFATVIGFIEPVSIAVPVMPAFVNGFFANGLQGAIVQVVQFIVIIMIYLPFFRYLDKQKVASELLAVETER